ncbi:MAG: aldo/keto reductase [Candidatus Bathyarchaeota archaeon]|nr:aldo/keto reductase [Candidatus Bathyarchaeota archaeon]
MEYRTLGKTGLRVSVVGLGGIPIKRIGEKEAVEVVNKAVNQGINLIHTAPTYGDSASKIGKALQGRRDQCILNVKVFGSTKETAQRQLRQALKMLRTDRIDIAQFRITEEKFDRGLGKDGGLQVLAKAQKDGIVDHIGITDHDPNFLAKAIKTGYFSNIIVPFNFVYNHAKEALIPLAKKMNIGIVAMKPLGRGVLLNVSESLNYIWEHGVSSAIVGMQRVKEVEENAQVGVEIQPPTQTQKHKLESLAKELRQKYNVDNGALLPLR